MIKRFPVALVCVMVPRQALPEEALPALAVAAHFPMRLSGVWHFEPTCYVDFINTPQYV
jgi:hypothetical protein